MLRISMWAALPTLMMAAHLSAEDVPFDSDRWRVQAQESSLAQHLGRDALMLKGGAAWLPDVAFKDGTIRFDMAFSKDRGFSGLAFRMADERNFEHFYLRPHRSGYPDANQYTPVFNGVAGWQLYFGPRYSVQLDYPFDSWIPVKVVVSGTEAEVFIGDMDRAVLFLPELKRGTGTGAIGVTSANFAPAWFSNFSFDQAPVTPTRPLQIPEEVLPENIVATWQVSNTFDAATLEGVATLDPAWADSLTWSPLDTEPPGFANIARLRSPVEGQNTVFARLTMEADQARSTLLEFGYSDLARVYLNGELLYAGNNTYMTRDFRYLGTIGLFDAVNLQLQPGSNEVWIAVTEQFGGWGVMARIPAQPE